jgi:dihydrofolate reductase
MGSARHLEAAAQLMEIVYYVAASVDGFIATPDGGIEWLRPFEGTDEDYGYSEFYASVEAVLLGRRTYEQCLQFPEWPYAGKPYWVFSLSSGNNPAKVVKEMQTRGIRRAWLVGGGKLAAAFRAERLISEHIVSVIPVILGAGVPLFDGAGPFEKLKLVSSRAYDSGIVQLRYKG